MLIVPVGLMLGVSTVSASMGEQLLYNVLGQVTNATGARLGDEIYYGSSRHARPAHHKTHRKHHKKKVAKPTIPVMTDEKRIQKALTSLGFYHGPIDGAVNSFETRSAIKALNQAYGISNSASLKPEVKDSLIYLGTLFTFDRNLIARGTDSRTKGKKIQTALKIHGFYHTKIDGAVGSGTRRSIAEYKAARGLSSGGTLDFEEEYQLVSTAKEMNDKNIEDTLASLKSLGAQYRAPVANTYQRQAVPQQPQYRQRAIPPQGQQPVQQVPVQQSIGQSTQHTVTVPVQQAAGQPTQQTETVPVNQLVQQSAQAASMPQNSPTTQTAADTK